MKRILKLGAAAFFAGALAGCVEKDPAQVKPFTANFSPDPVEHENIATAVALTWLGCSGALGIPASTSPNPEIDKCVVEAWAEIRADVESQPGGWSLEEGLRRSALFAMSRNKDLPAMSLDRLIELARQAAKERYPFNPN